MAEKQTILGRIAQLAKANINAILERAEDPQKMLDQMVRDYTNSIAEAENAVAVTVGNLRLAEADYKEDVAAAKEWGEKAAAAVAKAAEFRAAGKDSEADKFDKLARVALNKQIGFENEVKAATPTIESQRQVVEQLKAGLSQMRDKLQQLKNDRDSLIARAKSAEAQQEVTTAISSIDILDPTSELARYEEKVRQQEAAAAGQIEVAAATLESQFMVLEDVTNETEVEARLAALQAGNAVPQLEYTEWDD